MATERVEQSPSPEAQTETLTRGERLIKLRADIGLSQRELALEASLSQAYLCELERNEADNEGYLTTIALARALGVGINFWESQMDQRVFLRPEARSINKIIQSPFTTAPGVILLANIESVIPELEDPNLTYIECCLKDQRFGEIISLLRRIQGLTQEQVARGAGLSQGYLSQLENPEKHNLINPSMRAFQEIALILRTDIHDLLDLEQIHYPDVVVHVDRLFRSDQIPPESKKRARAVINSLIDLLKDPTFNRSGQESTTLTQQLWPSSVTVSAPSPPLLL